MTIALSSDMPLKRTKLYPITDRKLSGISHADQVVALSRGGANVIQFRDKSLSSRDFYEEAKKAVLAARQCNVTLIINDRVDVAMALEADGVHLGQDDLPPAAARQLLGDTALIGISTHNLDQLRIAVTLPVDYIAIGPIFQTSSKPAENMPVGLDMVRQARSIVGSRCLVAIGGITAENAAAVRAAGADAVAVISAILAYPQVASRTKELLSLC